MTTGGNKMAAQPAGCSLSAIQSEQTVQLESWPAQPIRQAPSSISLAEQQTTSKPPTVTHFPAPKPKFLQQLESYLEKELRLLACPPSGPHELRLQAHREVFGYLIEDFKTYKPLLSAIKTEYELYISHLQKTVKTLQPLSAEIEVVREECERRLLAVAQEEKKAEAGVEEVNKRLLKIIDGLRSKEKDYQRQVEKLQSEVAELYRQYRDEADARKLLVAEYNELKLQQAEGEGECADTAGKAGEERDDPTVLKLKLARAREDLRLANQRITGMMADYSDVVPRREFERMETAYKAMESELEATKSDHTSLMSEHRALQELYSGVVGERDRLTSSLAHLRGTATPRPEWQRCGEFVEDWREASDGRSSDQLVDLLIARLSDRSLEEVTALSGFQGKGKGEDVPRYLRWEGSVPNRRFSQRQVNTLITGFWKHSLTSDLQAIVVEDSLWEYLLSLHEGSEQKAVEDAYNLQDAVSRHGHEPHVALFSRVLSGEERLESVQQWMEGQAHLTEACAVRQDRGQGVISEASLREALRAAFPGKPPALVSRLVSCASSASSPHPQHRAAGAVDFIRALSPDDSGRPSQLVLELLEQQREETSAFVEQLQSALQNAREGVSVSDVTAAIATIDAAYPPSLLTTLLEPLYPDPNSLLPLSQVTFHLRACGLSRHSPHN